MPKAPVHAAPPVAGAAPDTLGLVARRPGLCALGVGLLHSLLLAAAFAPFNIWPLALIAALPLAWIALHPAAGQARPWRTVCMVWLGAIPFWAFVQQWTVSISKIGYAPMVAYTALTTAVCVLLMIAVRRAAPRWPAAVAVSVGWTAGEVFRGNIMWDGYPWYQIGHPLIEVPTLAATAALGGAYLVSFFVAMLVGALLDAAHRRWVSVVASAVVLGGALAAGHITREVEPAGQRLRVGVVQTNLPQSVKGDWGIRERFEDFQRWLEMSVTLAAASPAPDVLVWPETMYPGYFLDADGFSAIEAAKDRHPTLFDNISVFRTDMLGAQQLTGLPMLIGASAFRGTRVVDTPGGDFELRWDARWNSVLHLDGGRVLPERYEKLQLTPFGEVMPYISAWPWLERMFLRVGVGASGMAFDLKPGRGPHAFNIPTREGLMVRVATPICFEATIPDVCRRLVFENGVRRADILVQLTNDGWFGSFDPGREHHALAARWRAVELATPLVRVANTGISGLIDSRGRVLVWGLPGARSRTEGTMVLDAPLGVRTTLYARTGDIFGLAVFGLGMLAVTVALIRGTARNRRTSPARTE